MITGAAVVFRLVGRTVLFTTVGAIVSGSTLIGKSVTRIPTVGATVLFTGVGITVLFVVVRPETLEAESDDVADNAAVTTPTVRAHVPPHLDNESPVQALVQLVEMPRCP